jgi:hypothetical protein
MDDLSKEIQAYEGMKDPLEAEHMGKWVLIYKQKLEGVFDSFELAANDAVRRFGAGPYLIRQVGAPPVVLSASVMYQI